MTRAAALAMLVLVATVLAARASGDARYYPRVAGPAAGVLVGRLVEMGFGSGSGDVTLVTASGRRYALYTAPHFVVDGIAVACPLPPTTRFRRDRSDCPVWPDGVVVGRTIVRVPYWRGSRYGRPTLVARGLRSLPSAP